MPSFTDNLANYTDTLRVGRGMIDAKPVPTDALAGFYTMAVRSTELLNQWADEMARTETMPTSFVNWVTQELIGEKSGTNHNFTISYAPIPESMSVFMNGVRFVRVAGTPTDGEAQYGVSGTNVVLGTAPTFSQWCVARYFKET